MTRLGLWGPDTTFPKFSTFESRLKGKGYGMMEMLASHMKVILRPSKRAHGSPTLHKLVRPPDHPAPHHRTTPSPPTSTPTLARRELRVPQPRVQRVLVRAR